MHTRVNKNACVMCACVLTFGIISTSASAARCATGADASFMGARPGTKAEATATMAVKTATRMFCIAISRDFSRQFGL